MNLPQNLFDDNISIQTFLCQPNKEIMGEILPYDFNVNFKFNTYSEISFTIDKYYNDLFDGTTKIHPYYDLIESLRVIYLRGVGHFIIQDVNENEADTYTKTVTCFSLEYATGQKYLENFYINTGEEGSVETMYHAQKYGAEYSIDNYYTLVDKDNDVFDAFERYYIKDYVSGSDISYNYVEKQVLDSNMFNALNDEMDLYIKKYPNVRFYWPTCPELSLLHLVFDRIPEWKVGHVDKELWYQERTFSEDRTAVYDFLCNTAAQTLKFVMVWDSINGVVNFYKTEEDGLITDTFIRTNVYNSNFIYYLDANGTIAEEQPKSEEDVINGIYYINVGNDIETQWDTDVFISRENLVSSLDIQYSTDDIKTKLKITGSDELDVRDVNLGQNYILDLSYYNDPMWLGEDLHSRYNSYMEKLETDTLQYKEFISAWSAAYNEYNDLVNYIPIEPRVMLIGDEFEKLYCVYSKYRRTMEYKVNKTYYTYDKGKYTKVQPSPSQEEVQDQKKYFYIENTIAQVTSLQTKLETYKVDQDNKGQPSQMAKTDDVLLTLENDASDSATIRVRYDTNIKAVAYYDGKLTDENIGEKISIYSKSPYDDKSKINKANNEELMDDDVYLVSGYICRYDMASDKFICTNDPLYYIYRTLTTASTGVSNTRRFSLTDWVNGDLTADIMKLSGFKIKSIGTLGAYFCLLRDETKKEELEDYGIRLLQEKQDTYTKIFIAQTEGYMNEEGSQCVTSNEEPIGDEYPIGTKWLDTNNTNADGSLIMKHRTNQGWETYTPDDNDYENYARFYENFVKLGNVQTVLAEKQKQADYLLNGLPITALYLSDDKVNLYNLFRVAVIHSIVLDNDCYVTNIGEELPNEDIEEGAIWFLIDDKTLTTSIMKYTNQKWANYSPDVNINAKDYNQYFKFLTFTIGSDTKTEYAAYVVNGVPYVSYAHSQGLSLFKMNVIKEEADMNTFFNEQELVRLSPFIREDEYSDSNFLLTGYESEEEQMNIKQELLNAGVEELKKLCQPKLSFSATMANVLDIPEFAPLRSQFKLGNFIRVEIREGYVKRVRLLEVQINLDDPSDFSVTFGDLISTKSEVDKHADLLQQAVTAGKSVASNQSKWQRGADKATALDQAINDGLRSAALSVGAADGQSIVWDKYGIRGRKLREGSTNEYEPQQFALINNKLVFTDDNWETSRAVVGEFEIELPTADGLSTVTRNMYGLLADAVVGGYIKGAEIVGGSLQIGDGSDNYFKVNEQGDVEIVQAGQQKYASVDAVNAIDQAYKYSVSLSYSGSTVFAVADDEIRTTIIAKVSERGEEIEDVSNFKFNWIRSSSNPDDDDKWNNEHINHGNTLVIDHRDVINNSQFSCQVIIP